jgi:ubiquinone/menaquinone biosynthesis C-methylase UbiE
MTQPSKAVAPDEPGLLGDTSDRDYARKLQLFNAFAGPEIRVVAESLRLEPGMSVLDAGCGTGEALHWLHRSVSPGGSVLGVDLATAHIDVARADLPAGITVLQGDLRTTAITPATLDLIWSANTINHFAEPVEILGSLVRLVRPGGRIALAQSSFLPDMFFAWDARLERVVNEAVRSYYRDRYHLSERDLTSVRSLVGLLRRAGLQKVTPKTFVIERVFPVDPSTEAYIAEAIFRDTWGGRLRPYMAGADFLELAALCDPKDPKFALRREDFHFVQTFSLVTGERPVTSE